MVQNSDSTLSTFLGTKMSTLGNVLLGALVGHTDAEKMFRSAAEVKLWVRLWVSVFRSAIQLLDQL